MISISDAIAKNLERIRRPLWTNVEDHLKLTIFDDGTVGPWVELWSPTQLIPELKMPRPQTLLITQLDMNEAVYVPFLGEIPQENEKGDDDA